MNRRKLDERYLAEYDVPENISTQSLIDSLREYGLDIHNSHGPAVETGFEIMSTNVRCYDVYDRPHEVGSLLIGVNGERRLTSDHQDLTSFIDQL